MKMQRFFSKFCAAADKCRRGTSSASQPYSLASYTLFVCQNKCVMRKEKFFLNRRASFLKKLFPLATTHARVTALLLDKFEKARTP